jgi:hypothetical protein
VTSKTTVVTETYPHSGMGRSGGIVTRTSTLSEGDSSRAEVVAGHTAGMIGQGNAMAHGKYMADLSNIVYRKGG